MQHLNRGVPDRQPVLKFGPAGTQECVNMFFETWNRKPVDNVDKHSIASRTQTAKPLKVFMGEYVFGKNKINIRQTEAPQLLLGNQTDESGIRDHSSETGDSLKNPYSNGAPRTSSSAVNKENGPPQSDGWRTWTDATSTFDVW
jgi:hypothetical protein